MNEDRIQQSSMGRWVDSSDRMIVLTFDGSMLRQWVADYQTVKKEVDFILF